MSQNSKLARAKNAHVIQILDTTNIILCIVWLFTNEGIVIFFESLAYQQNNVKTFEDRKK
jgi:hypothetical protein